VRLQPLCKPLFVRLCGDYNGGIPGPKSRADESAQPIQEEPVLSIELNNVPVGTDVAKIRGLRER